MARNDVRFGVPLYTTAEAARFLAVPTSTFAAWAKGYDQKPLGRKPVHGDALASRHLYTDGARLLCDYAESAREEDLESLTVVVSGQRVFGGVVKEYLERIAYGTDGWAERVILPMTERAIVEVDPVRSFGQPIFLRGAARVEDVVDRWRAGEPLADVAGDFGVPIEDIEDVLRASVPSAA